MSRQMKEKRGKNKRHQWMWRILFIIGLLLASVWTSAPFADIPAATISLDQVVADYKSNLIKRLIIYQQEYIIISYQDGQIKEAFISQDTDIFAILEVGSTENLSIEIKETETSYKFRLLFITILTLLPCTSVSLFWLLIALIPSEDKIKERENITP